MDECKKCDNLKKMLLKYDKELKTTYQKFVDFKVNVVEDRHEFITVLKQLNEILNKLYIYISE
jgi:DNA gyrase/topoisomerase IV subunit A